MEIGFSDFKIHHPVKGRPVFSYRLKTSKFVELGKGHKTLVPDETGTVVIPLYINTWKPSGAGWKSIEYKFGSNKIVGFYREKENRYGYDG